VVIVKHFGVFVPPEQRPESSVLPCQVLDKDQNGKVTATPLMAVRYVPLTSPEQ